MTALTEAPCCRARIRACFSTSSSTLIVTLAITPNPALRGSQCRARVNSASRKPFRAPPPAARQRRTIESPRVELL
ncbi:MAG: hypothetical protein U5L11_00570 [Arhodomonas sp.]|nr:hypothetical protein [Arhodomonas sp.]